MYHHAMITQDQYTDWEVTPRPVMIVPNWLLQFKFKST